MQIIRYLLFVVLSLGWANITLAKNPFWPAPSDNDDVKKEVSEGIQQDDEGSPDSDQLAPPIEFYVPENEDWEMCLLGSIITLRPKSYSKGFQSGGPFGEKKLNFQMIQFGWKINGNDKTFIGDVTYSNSIYSYEEALNHPNCKSQTQVPIYVYGDTDSPESEKFLSTLRQLNSSGDCLSISSGESFSWFKDYHNTLLIYKYYKSSYIEEDTGESYDCSTTLILPTMKDGNYISSKQFDEIITEVKDSSGNQLDYNMPPTGNQLSDTKEGKGIELHPI